MKLNKYSVIQFFNRINKMVDANDPSDKKLKPIDLTPTSQPNMNGDPQSSATTAFLKKLVQEDNFNAFCIDCQRNRSSHCNVTYGTFICQECAQQHQELFSMHESYIKPVFSSSWDTFQLRVVQVGGNKRFFDFIKEYQKERDPIEKKYSSNASNFYRKMLSDQAQGKQVKELPPARNASEVAERTTNYIRNVDEKYQLTDKANELTAKTKQGILNLWAKATGKDDNSNNQQQDQLQ